MKNGTKVLIPVLVMAAMAGTAFLLPGLPWLSGEPVLANDSISDGQRAEIAAILEAMAANGQFSGTVLVSVRGEEVYSGAFGLADIERGVPNRVDTQFRIASATKPFTSLLVYQLVESGKLRFDDRLSDLVPEYPANKGADITVRHLLTHRSGITGEWRIPELEDIERHRWTREALLAEIAGRDLVFEPGTGNEYSNYGFVLLGMIIERAGGASYAEQLQERICDPAGMTHTRGDDNDAIIPYRALGYHFDYFLGPQHAPYIDMSFAFGAGHLLSTVSDLHRFAVALEDPAILPPAYREIFFTRSGWTVQPTPIGRGGRRTRGNYLSGSINGFASHILRLEEDGIFIALLKNLKEPGAQIVVKWPEYVTSRILAVLYGEPYSMPRKSAAFAVFEAVRDGGIEAGRRRYAELFTARDPGYYVDEEEFSQLSEVLPALRDAAGG
jgi:CubicO group peptidase (beta-lactamase class C family)